MLKHDSEWQVYWACLLKSLSMDWVTIQQMACTSRYPTHKIRASHAVDELSDRTKWYIFISTSPEWHVFNLRPCPTTHTRQVGSTWKAVRTQVLWDHPQVAHVHRSTKITDHRQLSYRTGLKTTWTSWPAKTDRTKMILGRETSRCRAETGRRRRSLMHRRISCSNRKMDLTMSKN